MTSTRTAQSFYKGHASAPARKTCPCCQRPKILLGKRSTYGIAYSGRLLCARCVQTDSQDF